MSEPDPVVEATFSAYGLAVPLLQTEAECQAMFDLATDLRRRAEALYAAVVVRQLEIQAAGR